LAVALPFSGESLIAIYKKFFLVYQILNIYYFINCTKNSFNCESPDTVILIKDAEKFVYWHFQIPRKFYLSAKKLFSRGNSRQNICSITENREKNQKN